MFRMISHSDDAGALEVQSFVMSLLIDNNPDNIDYMDDDLEYSCSRIEPSSLLRDVHATVFNDDGAMRLAQILHRNVRSLQHVGITFQYTINTNRRCPLNRRVRKTMRGFDAVVNAIRYNTRIENLRFEFVDNIDEATAAAVHVAGQIPLENGIDNTAPVQSFVVTDKFHKSTILDDNFVMTRLQTLHIFHWRRHHVRAILANLSNAIALQTLRITNVSNLDPTDWGTLARNIVEAAAQDNVHGISSLHLTQCVIEDHEVESFLQEWRPGQQSPIEILDLSHNQIQKNGAFPLLMATLSHPELKVLNLDANLVIGYKGLAKILTPLASLQLQQLKLHFVPIHMEDENVIQQAINVIIQGLQLNHHLVKFDISNLCLADELTLSATMKFCLARNWLRPLLGQDYPTGLSSSDAIWSMVFAHYMMANPSIVFYVLQERPWLGEPFRSN